MTLRILMGASSEDPGTRSVPAQERPLSGIPIEPPHFSEFPPFQHRRSTSFGCSVLGHAVVVCAMLFLSGPGTERPAKPLLQNYSVRYLQLQVPPPHPRLPAGGSSSEDRKSVV